MGDKAHPFGFTVSPLGVFGQVSTLSITPSPSVSNSSKTHVIDLLLFIVIVIGLVVPVTSPSQFLKTNPVNGVANNETVSFSLYVFEEGETFPDSVGVICIDNEYCI